MTDERAGTLWDPVTVAEEEVARLAAVVDDLPTPILDALLVVVARELAEREARS